MPGGRGRANSELDLGMARPEVLGQRGAHAPPLLGAGHPEAAEQLLLILERQAGDLPADRQALEEEIDAPLPAGLGPGGRPRVQLLELPQRAAAELVAEREDVALLVRVVARGRRGCVRLALAAAAPAALTH